MWHHLSVLRSIPQDYRLFGKLAGVRDPDVPPISEPRGLPADTTFLTRYAAALDAPDAFSYSWISAAEVLEIGSWYAELRDRDWGSQSYEDTEKWFGYVLGGSWELHRYKSDRRIGLEDARVVFWFK